MRWTALGALFATFATANAGTIRDDVPDSSYKSLAGQTQFDAIGKVNGPAGYATGTLLSSQWVLTAAHVIDNDHNATADGAAGSYTFTIGNNTYTGAQIQFAPSWNGYYADGRDLVLVKLATPVTGIAAAEIYAGSSELGQTLTMVGFGDTGTGLTGATVSDGLKRAGTNVLDFFTTFSTTHNQQDVVTNATTSDSASATGLLWDFDNPSGTGVTAMEYAGADHDSGAPMFVTANGAALVAGVLSDGINSQTSYGAIDYGSRVSAYKNWIDDTTALHWAAPASGTFGTAASWSETATPGAYEIASFNAAGTYSVTLAADAANRKLLVRSGDVTLDLAGHTFTQSAQNLNGSVTIGRDSGDSATLRITNGKLAAVDGFVAAQAGSTGLVTLTGAGTEWTLSESLFIGGSRDGAGGSGSVSVGSGAKLSVGRTLKIFADAQLDIAGSMAATAIDVSGGTLLLSGATAVRDRVNDDAAMILNGNATIGAGNASIITRGLSEVTGLIVDAQHPNGIDSGTHGLGALTLSSNSVLDFGADNTTLGILQFASLSGDPIANAGRTLDIVNWDGNAAGGGLDQLRFDTSIAGAIDLSQIRFFDGFGQGLGSGMQIAFNGYFEIVPVPEPATVFGAVFLLGLAGWHERRRPARFKLRAQSAIGSGNPRL